MQHNGVNSLDESLCLCALKACGRVNNLDKGCDIHDQLVKYGNEVSVVVGSALVDMYGSCGRVEEARQVFDSRESLDVVAWGAMAAAYGLQGDALSVLELYMHMQGGSVKPDKAILVCTLKACIHTQAFQQGHMIHDHVVRTGLESDAVIDNVLLNLYADCECLEDAQRVFNRQYIHDAVSWSTIIAAYTQGGHHLASLELFEKMQNEEVQVDAVLLLCIVNTFGFVGFWKNGMFIHDQLIKRGWESLDFIVQALISMYGKFGSVSDALIVFDIVEGPDNNIWGELIATLVVQGHGEQAHLLHERMEKASLIPNEATAMWLLKACNNKEQGMSLHSHVTKCGRKALLPIANSIIAMYAKCGRMREASEAFIKMPTRDKVTWSAMISGAIADGSGGHAGLVREWVAKLQVDCLHPDDAIYTSLLQACSQAGSIEDGLSCFSSSSLAPSIEHYSCMIDLLGRSGCLNVAEDMVHTMPFQDDVLASTSLLNSSRTYRSVQIENHHVDTTLTLNPYVEPIQDPCNFNSSVDDKGSIFQSQGVFS